MTTIMSSYLMGTNHNTENGFEQDVSNPVPLLNIKQEPVANHARNSDVRGDVKGFSWTVATCKADRAGLRTTCAASVTIEKNYKRSPCSSKFDTPNQGPSWTTRVRLTFPTFIT